MNLRTTERTLHEFEVANLPTSVQLIRGFVSHEISALPLSAQARFDLLTALVEAADNAVLHGQNLGGRANVIRTRVVWTEDAVHVELMDNGPGFRPILDEWKLPDLMAEKGRGVYLMKTLVDRVAYGAVECGTKCVLTKRFDSDESDEEYGKKSPAALSGSQLPNIYRSLIENAIEGIWVVDSAGATTFVNERAAEMLGYSARQMLGRSFLDFLSEESRDEYQVTKDCNQGGESRHFEVVLCRKDGGVVHALVAASPMYDGKGRYAGSLALLTDMTEARSAEEALKDAEAKAGALIRYAPTAIFEIDFTGPRFTRVNDAMCVMSGYAREELLDMNPLDLLQPEGRILFKERIDKVLAGEHIPDEVEYKVNTKDGHELWVGLNVRFVYEGAVVTGAFVIGHDVTERRRFQRDQEKLLDAYETELARVLVLKETNAAAASSLSLPQMADRFLGLLRERMELCAGSVYYLDETETILKRLALFGHPSKISASTESIPVDENSRIGMLLVRDLPILTHERGESLEAGVQLADGMGLGNARWVALPIEAKERKLGALTLVFPGRRPFEDEELSLYRSMADQLGVAMENARLLESEREAAFLTEALNEIDVTIHSSLNSDEILQRVLSDATVVLGADSAGMSRREGSLWHVGLVNGITRALLGRRMSDAEEPHAVLAIETGDVVAIEDAQNDERTPGDRMREFGIRSVLVTPLVIRETALGVIFFNFQSRQVRFSKNQIDFARKLAASVSLALENARLYEEEHHVAEVLREALIRPIPNVPRLDLGVVYRGASEVERVGGDFYDVFHTPVGRIAVVAGDVSGKGVKAAAITETVRSGLRSLVEGERSTSPSAILSKLNRALISQLDPGVFVTTLLLLLDPATREVAVASAGHPAPVRWCASGCSIVELAAGPPLGIEDGEYLDSLLRTSQEELFFLYSDGLTEARRRDEFYGEERLLKRLSKVGGSTAQSVVDCVVEDATKFAKGRLGDDLVALAFRLLATGSAN